MIFKKGNIIDEFKTGRYNFLLHQANCHGLMGGGVAAALSTEWPWLAEVDKQYLEGAPRRKYGSYSTFGTNFGEIVNLYGQFEPGGPQKKGLDTFEERCHHLKLAMTKFANNHSGSVIMPYIASGIASDWDLRKDMSDKEYFMRYIMPIVEESLPNWDIVVIGP